MARSFSTTLVHCLFPFTMVAVMAAGPAAMAQASSSAVGARLPDAPKPSRVETSLSVGVAPQLTASRLSTGQGFAPSAGIAGSFRQQFRPWLGYSVNLGYDRVTGHNLNAYGPPGSTFDIPANMYEASLSYVASKTATRKMSVFADVGAGAMIFLPVHRGADAARYVPFGAPGLVPPVTFRPLGVAGGGLDYHFTPHLAMRAEYRGLIYKYPDYGLNLGKALTLTTKPTLSVVYTFGHKR